MTNPERISPDSIGTYRGPDSYDRETGTYTWFLNKLGNAALEDLVVEGGPYDTKTLKTLSGRAPTEEQAKAYQMQLEELSSQRVILTTGEECPVVV